MDFQDKCKAVLLVAAVGLIGYGAYNLVADKDASTDAVVALLRDPASAEAAVNQFSKNGRTGMTLSQLKKIESDCTKSVGRPCGNGYIEYSRNAIIANRIEVMAGTVVTNESNKLFSFYDMAHNGCTYLGTQSEASNFSMIVVDRKSCQAADGGQLIEKVSYAIPLYRPTPVAEGTKLSMYRTVVMPFLGRMIDPSVTAERLVEAIEACKQDEACAKELPK